jgi:hypothetical protein
MLDAILFYYMLGIASRVKCTSEYFLEFLVQATNAQLFKVEILLKYLPLLHSVTQYLECLVHGL